MFVFAKRIAWQKVADSELQAYIAYIMRGGKLK